MVRIKFYLISYFEVSTRYFLFFFLLSCSSWRILIITCSRLKGFVNKWRVLLIDDGSCITKVRAFQGHGNICSRRKKNFSTFIVQFWLRLEWLCMSVCAFIGTPLFKVHKVSSYRLKVHLTVNVLILLCTVNVIFFVKNHFLICLSQEYKKVDLAHHHRIRLLCRLRAMVTVLD